MNLMLFEPSELQAPGALRVRAPRAQQLLEVKGLRPGSTIKVGSYNGPIHLATVVAIDSTEVLLQVDTAVCFPEPEALSLTLLLALPRPQSLKKILQTVAELGVANLILVGATRVEASYFQSKLLQEENIRAQLRLGLEQAIATTLCQVSVSRRLGNALELLPHDATRLVAHTKASRSLEAVWSKKTSLEQPIVLAVGPEGGWSSEEIERFAAAGFAVVSSGSRMLRVDTAVSLLLSQITLLQRLGLRHAGAG